MNEQSIQERLRGPLEGALSGIERARAESAKRRDSVPRSGDLFVFAETAAAGVLWAVVEHHSATGHLLVVPADLNRLVGSTDVAVPADASGDALSVRCQLAVRLEAADFRSAKRTGVLEPGAVERIRRRRAEIETGGVFGSVLERETDVESDYRDWIEEVGNAQVALFRKLRRRDVSAFSKAVGKSGQRARPRAFGFAVAAAVLLFLGGGYLWQLHEIADLERRLAGVEQPQALLNLPFVLLRAADVRGEATTLEVPANARFIHLILAVDGSRHFSEYRLEILEKDADEPLWSSSELKLTGISEISVALPREAFFAGEAVAGEYRLILYGLRDGEAITIDEYALELESRAYFQSP
ncbi:MAG: hypothetical protein V3T72_05305 [Thermoanaerobaculia bacterium]